MRVPVAELRLQEQRFEVKGSARCNDIAGLDSRHYLAPRTGRRARFDGHRMKFTLVFELENHGRSLEQDNGLSAARPGRASPPPVVISTSTNCPGVEPVVLVRPTRLERPACESTHRGDDESARHARRATRDCPATPAPAFRSAMPPILSADVRASIHNVCFIGDFEQCAARLYEFADKKLVAHDRAVLRVPAIRSYRSRGKRHPSCINACACPCVIP